MTRIWKLWRFEMARQMKYLIEKATPTPRRLRTRTLILRERS